ncbi:MAG: lysozyme [Burkholderiaceae bacterium]|nr:lysozyme [Burkholderiaceae bacterium]
MVRYAGAVRTRRSTITRTQCINDACIDNRHIPANTRNDRRSANGRRLGHRQKCRHGPTEHSNARWSGGRTGLHLGQSPQLWPLVESRVLAGPSGSTAQEVRPMAKSVSSSFLGHICGMEGLRTKVYSDSGGVATIGCGHTGAGVREGTISKDRAYQLLRADVARFEKCVNDSITAPLTQSMFDALVSIAYNMGCTGAMKNAGLADLVNARRYSEAAEKIKAVGLTDRAGNRLAGLVSRRKIESAMFLAEGMPGIANAVTSSPLLTKTTGTPIPAWSWWVAGGLVAVTTAGIIRSRLRRNTSQRSSQ